MASVDIKILVVEDNGDLAQLWKIVLTRAGIVATFCKTGAAALDWVRGGFHPNVLMTDYFLPDMTGGELIEAVRGTCATKFLLVTGNTDVPNAPADAEILLKPVPSDLLVKKILSLCDRAE